MTAFRCHNRVVLLLLAGLIAALTCLSFINFAPNRLVSGQPYGLWQLSGLPIYWLIIPLLALFAAAFLPRSGVAAWSGLVGAEATFLLLLWMLISAAQALAQQASPIARISPGGGWWLALCFSLLICSEACKRITHRVVLRWLLMAQVWLVPLIMLFSGAFDGLALLKEYASRQQVFNDALLRHMVLLVATLIPGLIISLPLGFWCARHLKGQSHVFTLLNIIQTIPSVALFGLLIAPLAGLARRFPLLADLGVSGIGMAPALIALVLYALLPLVRAVAVGIEQVPADAVESAKGMGMSGWQIALHIELPLALPVLLRGLKVVAVQTVGMAVIAALIGAGGLGALVFQGVLSSALDLVLLGVIPVVALAVVVDALFSLAIAILETGHD